MPENERRIPSPVVVTGGTKGIGRATVEALARDGHPIALCSRSHADAKGTALELTANFGVETFGAAADVRDAEQLAQFAVASERALGSARVLVNCAAILGPVGALDVLGNREWVETLRTNVVGTAQAIEAFAPQIGRAGEGRVVNLSGGGVGGPTSMERTSAYVTSKFAVAGLTEALAGELAAIGATVNAIAPGSIPTNFMESVLDAGPDTAGLDLYRTAVERSMSEIGDSLEPFLALLRYLISREAGGITGRVLSAKWDDPERLRQESGGLDNSMFRLRRIDGELFGATP